MRRSRCSIEEVRRVVPDWRVLSVLVEPDDVAAAESIPAVIRSFAEALALRCGMAEGQCVQMLIADLVDARAFELEWRGACNAWRHLLSLVDRREHPELAAPLTTLFRVMCLPDRILRRDLGLHDEPSWDTSDPQEEAELLARGLLMDFALQCGLSHLRTSVSHLAVADLGLAPEVLRQHRVLRREVDQAVELSGIVFPTFRLLATVVGVATAPSSLWSEPGR